MSASNFNFEQTLDGCLQGDRNCQRRLFEYYHGYAMSICLRFARHRDEAAEILNEGFFKALRQIGQYDSTRPFRFWLRQILINAAVDHFRSRHRFLPHEEWTSEHDADFEETPDPEIYPGEDVLPVLQELSPAYRTVFNLYVMEAFSHREIADLLGISEAASRSNLTRAKEQLRALWIKKHGLPVSKPVKKLGS